MLTTVDKQTSGCRVHLITGVTYKDKLQKDIRAELWCRNEWM